MHSTISMDCHKADMFWYCTAAGGMQNSALGAVLAAVHFSDPLTAVPCALSACLHSLMGSAWRSSDATGEKAETMAVY